MPNSILPLQNAVVKQCTKCKFWWPLWHYRHDHKGRGKYGRLAQCKDCCRMKLRAWRNLNPHKQAEYYRNNLDQEQERSRLKRRRQWAENPEKMRTQQRERRRVNHERTLEQARQSRYKRKALKQKSRVGPVPTLSELLDKQGKRCAYCKTKQGPFHLDHIMPLSLGGPHTADNVQALCQPCNQKKYNKHPLDFAHEQGRLL